MAKAKKARKTAAKRGAKRAPARGKKKATSSKPRAASAADRRVVQLEAENRRLREEIAALRAEREVTAGAGEPATDRPPALEL